MKKYFILSAVAALALASCTSDEYVGTEVPAGSDVISFNGGTGVVSRAAKTGAEAATALNKSFVVYGFKTNSDDTKSKVYDHYTVNYLDGTALSTPSNSAGWEYVNQPLSILTGLDKAGGAVQDIKYWDLAASQYDFIAFSAGANEIIKEGDPSDDQLLFTAVNNASLTTAAYTIKGSVADLAEVYIADRVTATKDATVKPNLLYQYKNAIQFNFRSLGSKVRMGIYETIPGYSVKDVKFYDHTAILADGDQAPTLYADDELIPGGTGTVTVLFPEDDEAETDYNKAHVTFAGGTNTQELTLSTAANFKTADISYSAPENKEASGTYLGRHANQATMTAYETVLPATAGALTLKVDYTLVSKDGSDEEIKVTGATATVPAKYCTWQPNYAYTYLFKITDKTSGNIGDDPAGLYPITFDAIVTNNEDGVQETITAVEPNYITTYQKGKVVTENDEYTAGDIYVTVDGTTALTSSNAKLYTAAIETGADQEITEGSVENCLKNYTGVTISETPTAVADLTVGTSDVSGYYTKDGAVYTKCATGAKAEADVSYYDLTSATVTGYVVKDKDDKKLTVTVSNALTTDLDAIPATATPDGNELAIKCAKIDATAGTTYVFEYINSGVKTYKVIKVVE